MTATTYIGAKRLATKDGFEIVYHDLETGEFGACPRGQPQGHFDETQRFHEHECIYFPASMPAADMEDIERCNIEEYNNETEQSV